VFRRPEGQFTSVLLRGFQIQLTVYHSRTGALPLRLGDLASIGLLPSLGSIDEWGEPVVYSVRGDEFEVRSAGPDRRLNTHDDMVVQGFDPVLRAMDSGPSPLEETIPEAEPVGLTRGGAPR
jgi:hypothetical protein